jgi:adenine specific DNA methylase Mod
MTGSDKMMDAVKPSSLTNLVNQSQGSATQKIDYKVLEKFLNAIDEGGSGYTSRWVLDSANPDKRSGSVKLTGKEAVVRMNYVNKPLVWSLVVNGKKQNGAIFQIFSVNGKLYYQSQNPTKSGQQNTTGYEELTPKTVGSAIQRFNLSVSL